MTGYRKFRWSKRWAPHFLAVALIGCGLAHAQDANTREDVVERYEQILERSPVEGPSFDKLLQTYQEGDGLEKLDERWTPWSAQPGAKGATYSLLRGLLADRMGKTDDARKFLQTSTQIQPDDFHGWMAFGDFEVRQGKWTDAIAALQKGLTTNVTGDDRLSLYRKLGQAQQRNLDVPAALATWQKMVEEFPKDPFALEEAGGAELDAEQFDEAKKTFQQLVDLAEPNSMARVQALMHLAEVDDRQGKTDATVHDYEAILPLTADSSWLNRELRAQIEQVYRREDDLAGLVAYYQKWTQDNPKDIEALLLLAGTLNELGKKPEALDVLRKVTTLAPDRHEVRESFAQALVDAKQYDEAITVLTALTADDPTEPRYWETMGDALWLKTQPPTLESKKAVLDAWGHIAPADSKDIAAMLQVADLCQDHALNDEALAGYQRALAMSPDASDIREKEVKLLVNLKRQDEAWKLLDQMTDGPLATAANYLKLATLDQQFDRKDAEADAIQKGLALEPGNFDLLSMEWGRLADAQKWSDCVALFDKLMAAAPNAYFTDQLEARQLQALTSAGMLDDAEKKLHAKLGTDPGMTEGELRLLLRVLIQKSDPDIAKALDEAHRRFPQSVSLIQIEVEYDRHIGNDDAAVAALQKLIETVPEQKNDWLSEIVHVRRDQGNLDEALKAAQEIIDASPASADGYLLYADIALAAEKPDAAVEKWQAAIKLSDKPNEVRQRLAKYYLEAGQAAKARTIYDEAFAAADNPQDKLTIVRAMTAAYFQDGQIEELINRFRKEQNSEEGGWRYGLYLSAIDEQMEDFGGARRELAKSLAVRPNDTGLLHSLIGLADKDNDGGELLRYREMLAEADPSATNEIALANEYAVQDKPEDAWRIVQKNLGEVVKDPLAWKDVLNQISDPTYAAKVKSVLEEAIRAKGDSFDGKFALAQFQMQQGDLDGAKATLWEIIAQPLPPVAAPAPTAATKPPGSMMSVYNLYQTPMMQRAQASYLAINEAQQLLSSAAGRTQGQQMNIVHLYNRMGVSTTLDPTAIKDHSLIYLSYIEVQQKQAEEFLKELQGKIDSWHWSVAEKLMAYTLIQARDPLLQEIEEQAKSGAPDKDLDQFCFMASEQFTSLPPDDPIRKRAEAAQEILSARLAQDPQFKSFTVMMTINRLSADTSPEGVAKRNAAVTDYLKTLDRKDPQQLLEAIGLCAQVGNWAEIKTTTDELVAMDPSKLSITLTQQLNYLPNAILQQATTTKAVMPKEVVPVVIELMRLGYPTTPPRPMLPSGQSVGPGGIVISGMIGNAFYNQNTFPPANRYFPIDRVGMIEPMYQQLKARDMMPAMYAALEQEEKDLGDWRAIYPTLMTICFQWWDGKHDDAIASVRKLMEQDPSDDWKMLLASMLTLEQKYDDAIPVLESVSARYGPDYIRTQKQLLHVARLAKNNDVGQKAALRLLALRLPQMEQMQIMDDLRNVGLQAKADEIIAKQTQGMPGANSIASAQANNQLIQTLNAASNGTDGAKAIEIAREVLNRDPLTPTQNGNENYLRTMALNALKKFEGLDAYTQELEKQIAATPDSVRLNWLLGEAYSAAGDSVRETRGLLPGYHWLKLQRTGNKFELFSSLDGTTWKSAGNTEMELPSKLYVGAWVLSLNGPSFTEATFNQIALSGKVTSADAPIAPASAPTPLAAVPNDTSTNAPPALTLPPNSLPTPWQEVDIGKAITPGKAVRGKDENSLVFTGAISGQGFSAKDDAYHFVYQMLDGDGSIVARISDIYQQPDNTNCGLLLRETLDPESRGVGASISRMRGVVWQTRNMAGSPWIFTEHREFTTPGWLKLARVGNKFTASYSNDGQAWSEIFSRQVGINPSALAGLYVRSQNGGEMAWSELKVNGTAVPIPVPGTWPASWQPMDIGTWATPGKTTWTDTGIKMQPPSGPGPGANENNRQLGSYAGVPVTGDGEIVARLDGFTPTNDLRETAGLFFRNDKEVDSSDVHFVCTMNGEASFICKTDTQAQAVHYFQRVAELDPKNQALLVSVAEQLRRAHKPDAAADLYVSILKGDFGTTMSQAGNVEQAFAEANRLPEFVKIIQDWTPPPLNPMYGGGQDMYFTLLQLANQMRQGNYLPEAEQVLRKALTLDTFQSKQDGVATLAQMLLDEDRRDEAAAELEKWITDKSTPVTPPPVLGFTVQVQSQNNWFQVMSWSSNGIIMAPIVNFLQMADALGLTPKLQQELKAKADKSSAMPGGQIDSNRMAGVLLKIISHDVSYRSDLEKLLKDYPAASPNMAINANGYLILSQQLEKWPQERPMAERVTKTIYDGMSSGAANAYILNVVVTQMLKLAQASGDHKAVQDILRKRADSMREQRAANPNQVPFDQVLTVVREMIQEGMLQDAANLLTDAKTDPQLANGNAYYKLRVDDMEAQMAFAKGEKSPVLLVYGLTPKSGKRESGTEIFWQINAGPKDPYNSPYFSYTSWTEGMASRPSGYKLEVNGGTDEQHLAKFASWENVATRGTATLGIPPGTRVIQAVLIGTKPDAAVTPAPGTDAAPVAVARGQMMYLGGTDNLLKNPTFQVSKDATGLPIVAGWHGAMPSGISQEPGGPLSAAGYQTLDTANSNYGVGGSIVSDRITIQPDTNYVVSGWMRLFGDVSFRYLDASGKVLNQNQSNFGGNDTDWQWRAWRLEGDPQSPDGGTYIPANAAFFQVVFRLNQDSDFAGLSVRVWPASAGK